MEIVKLFLSVIGISIGILALSVASAFLLMRIKSKSLKKGAEIESSHDYLNSPT